MLLYILSEASPPGTDPLCSAPTAVLQRLVAGWCADSCAEGCLQVAQWQRSVHWPVNLSPTPLGQFRFATHVEVDKGWYRVEGLTLQGVLYTGVCLAGLHHCLLDEEMECFQVPVAGEDKVSLAGVGVPDEEITVVHHQAL